MEARINDFAIRSFRDSGDGDYIAARMAFQAKLMPQFLWLAHQTIEKYLKCVLLLNRIVATRVLHDLVRALDCLRKGAKFELRVSKRTQELIEWLNNSGRFRYFEVPYYVFGPEGILLDKAVWEIRRYCAVIDYHVDLPDGTRKQMLPLELDKIAQSEKRPPHEFSLGRTQLGRLS
jgi:hypothetical protein